MFRDISDWVQAQRSGCAGQCGVSGRAAGRMSAGPLLRAVLQRLRSGRGGAGRAGPRLAGRHGGCLLTEVCGSPFHVTQAQAHTQTLTQACMQMQI